MTKISNILNIDDSTYPLDERKYFQNEFEKKQIVIGHTFTEDMRHYIGWQNRYNGKYKKNAVFTIDVNGNIYQHFDPKYYSNFVGLRGVDEKIIGITLINKGWLIKNDETNEYVDYLNNPYNGKVVRRRWRNKTYWAPYSKKQIESLVKLCKYLCNKYGIQLKTLGHNTKTDNVFDYEGVVFRSNYMTEYTDLSPAFDFLDFKNKLELNSEKDERID